MTHKTRPAPLKDLQNTVHADQSRRYLILDAHSSLLSPAYPFDQQIEPSVGTLWHDHGDPPISPPPSSPRTLYPSKRSARTFALVPAQVNGKRVFTHVVVNPQDSESNHQSRPTSFSSQKDGLPEDMRDILRQLDDLASWVKEASSSTDCNVTSIVNTAGDYSTRSLGDGLCLNKGKHRLLSSSPLSECDTRRDLVDPSDAASGNPSSTNCRPEGFIYVPDCNTPEFLVGSSSSPIAYPVCGYSSHPSRYSPFPPNSTHAIPSHRRFLERRSAPCPTPTSPLVSPLSGKTSFKTLFQRSRCNTTAVPCPSIPSTHVPVENALRQGKRMRLPWLRI